MRTVKEFKDAGVVFVEGDAVFNGDYFALHYWLNGDTNQFDKFASTIVESFAWRDLATKPDNAKFKIEIDIANHRWRPSLNQGEEWPDEQRIDVICQNGNDGIHHDNTAQQIEALANDNPVKPVFTQAMADAGDLPPVGSFVLLNSDKEGEPEDLNFHDHCQVDCWERNSLLEVIAHTEIAGVILPVVKFKNAVSSIMLNFIKPIPKTITVNGFEVPEPMIEAPKDGQRYFLASPASSLYFISSDWNDEDFDHRYISRGLVHSTKEAAIAHSKAMLGIDPNADA